MTQPGNYLFEVPSGAAWGFIGDDVTWLKRLDELSSESKSSRSEQSHFRQSIVPLLARIHAISDSLDETSRSSYESDIRQFLTLRAEPSLSHL